MKISSKSPALGQYVITGNGAVATTFVDLIMTVKMALAMALAKGAGPRS